MAEGLQVPGPVPAAPDRRRPRGRTVWSARDRTGGDGTATRGAGLRPADPATPGSHLLEYLRTEPCAVGAWWIAADIDAVVRLSAASLTVLHRAVADLRRRGGAEVAVATTSSARSTVQRRRTPAAQAAPVASVTRMSRPSPAPRIVVGVDRSFAGMQALRTAVQLARRDGAHLTPYGRGARAALASRHDAQLWQEESTGPAHRYVRDVFHGAFGGALGRGRADSRGAGLRRAGPGRPRLPGARPALVVGRPLVAAGSVRSVGTSPVCMKRAAVPDRAVPAPACGSRGHHPPASGRDLERSPDDRSRDTADAMSRRGQPAPPARGAVSRTRSDSPGAPCGII